MELSIFTVVALIGVVVLFGSGVLLIWKGLRSPQEHLPQGADVVLDAIASGGVVPPTRREYGRDMTGEHVRLIPAGADGAGEPTVDVREQPASGAPDSTTDSATEDEEASADRQPVGVAGLRADDTGELPINQREFFSVEPQLKRF